MSAAQFAHVQELLAPDAQRLVESLRPFAVNEIGSKAWLNQHTAVEKLNLQAQHSIVKQGDEYVIEALVDYDKLPLLIAELIALEAWQEQALPSLFDEIATKNSVKGYFILYHEALLLGLLEKAVFHKHAIAAAGDMLLELADFCYRKALFLNHGKLQQMLAEPGASASASESLRHQQCNITYGVSMSCLTIIRFLLEAQDELPLGVLARFVEENDILHALVPLLESQPWLRKNKKGINEKFSDGRWYEVDGDEIFRLSKTEAQVWISIYHICLGNEARRKYKWDQHSKANVMRARKYMSEVLLDQIPNLSHLQRFLDQLAISAPPESASSALLVSHVPVLRENIMRSTNWPDVIAASRRLICDISEEEKRRELKEIADVYAAALSVCRPQPLAHAARSYGQNNYEEFMEDPKCRCGPPLPCRFCILCSAGLTLERSACGKPAEKRCSRCKLEWYCSRECQVAAWKDHKKLCDVMVSAQAEDAKIGAKATEKENLSQSN